LCATIFDVETIRLIDEADLEDAHRRGAGELLSREWGDDWLGDAHAGPYAPSFRALALDPGGSVAGQVSAFAIPTSPPRILFGIGDLVVRTERRGHGIAARICVVVVNECWRRGAEIVLVDTVAARRIFARLGFEAVAGFRYFYSDEHACHRHEHWMVAERAPADGPIELLEHGDF
jgi:predicted N-acetyltransferase YhbS